MAKNKERLDILLVQRGLAETRARAQAIIMSGNVYVAGQRADKAGPCCGAGGGDRPSTAASALTSAGAG